jgi:hypothetical protein
MAAPISRIVPGVGGVTSLLAAAVDQTEHYLARCSADTKASLFKQVPAAAAARRISFWAANRDDSAEKIRPFYSRVGWSDFLPAFNLSPVGRYAGSLLRSHQRQRAQAMACMGTHIRRLCLAAGETTARLVGRPKQPCSVLRVGCKTGWCGYKVFTSTSQTLCWPRYRRTIGNHSTTLLVRSSGN